MVIGQQQLEQIAELLDSTAKFTRVSFMLLGANRKMLYKSGTCSPYCKRLLSSKEAQKLCNAHYGAMCAKVEEERTEVVHTCHAGMWTMGIPLQFANEFYGTLIASQVKIGPLNVESEKVLRKYVTENQLDRTEYDMMRAETLAISEEKSTHLQSFVRKLVAQIGVPLTADKELEDIMNELNTTYEELTLGYEISEKIGTVMEIDSVLEETLKAAVSALDVKFGVTMFMDRTTDTLQIKNHINLDDDQLKNFWKTKARDILWGTVTQNQSFLVNNILEKDKSLAIYPFRSILAVPLNKKNLALGCLILSNKNSGEPFTARDDKLVSTIGVQASKALENSLLYDDIRLLLLDTVQALVTIIESRNPVAKGHSTRVASYAVEIARRLPKLPCSLINIKLAAFLHDIGKVGLPAGLFVPGKKLTQEQAVYVRKHPQIGYEFVSKIKQLRPILDGVLYHHELYNGRGYPKGLSGENIPLLARILSLADVYDHWNSMPRKNGMTAEAWQVAIMNRFRKGAGTEFDPAVVEAFVRYKQEKDGIQLPKAAAMA